MSKVKPPLLFSSFMPKNFFVDYLKLRINKKIISEAVLEKIRKIYPDLKEYFKRVRFFKDTYENTNPNINRSVTRILSYRSLFISYEYLVFSGPFATEIFNLMFFHPEGSIIRETCKIKRLDLKLAISKPELDKSESLKEISNYIYDYHEKHTATNVKKKLIKESEFRESERGVTVALGVWAHTNYYRICAQKNSTYFELELKDSAFSKINSNIEDFDGSTVIYDLVGKFKRVSKELEPHVVTQPLFTFSSTAKRTDP